VSFKWVLIRENLHEHKLLGYSVLYITSNYFCWGDPATCSQPFDSNLHQRTSPEGVIPNQPRTGGFSRRVGTVGKNIKELLMLLPSLPSPHGPRVLFLGFALVQGGSKRKETRRWLQEFQTNDV